MSDRTFAGLLIYCVFSSLAQAQRFEYPISSWQQIYPPGHSFFQFSVQHGNRPSFTTWDYIPGTTLFEGIRITAAGSGQTYVLSSVDDDPEYGEFIRYLTDGVDNVLIYAQLAGGEAGPVGFVRESVLLGDVELVTYGGITIAENIWPVAPVVGFTDFQAYRVNSVALHVDQLSILDKAAGDCESEYACTEVVFDGSLLIDATLKAVPVPATLALLSSAFLFLGLATRSARRS